MLSQSSCKALIACMSVAFITHIVYKYYNNRKKSKKPKINEVIMFSYGVAELKKSKYSRCMITRSMDRLLFYLNSPRHSIDICMYVMTNADLTNAILKLNIRGVKVRVILDADAAFSNGSALRRLEKLEIPVRWMKSTNLMHHKFCLIDTNMDDCYSVPFVIMGSLNWTNQALNGNWEDITVTSQKDIVRQFKTEFDRLWCQFKPIVNI